MIMVTGSNDNPLDLTLPFKSIASTASHLINLSVMVHRNYFIRVAIYDF